MLLLAFTESAHRECWVLAMKEVLNMFMHVRTHTNEYQIDTNAPVHLPERDTAHVCDQVVNQKATMNEKYAKFNQTRTDKIMNQYEVWKKTCLARYSTHLTLSGTMSSFPRNPILSRARAPETWSPIPYT